MHRFLLLATCAFAVTMGQPSVTIKNGTVNGFDLPQYNQSLFLGIPYAQPPVGALRLRLPQSINSSFGTLDAVEYGPHCWSKFTTGFDDNSGYNNSEDCLTLNVIRPTGASEKNQVPVVFWIHGGGLTTGGSADKRYNGTWLVQASIANNQPIVHVSVNYRLASLGFLSSKELASEGVLNLGLRDQRLALHWVQENIAKFGGDPSKVTIQGQSAGASSVHAHIIAYNGRDDKLFNQGIAESGSGGNYTAPDQAAFQANYDTLLANTSCALTLNSSAAAQLACLQSLSIDEFRQNSVGTTGMVNDGDIIQAASSFKAYKAGKFVKVKGFLSGSNTDEGQSFATLGENTTVQVLSVLSATYAPQFVEKLLDLYPDVPELGVPFHTGDFQLDPVQNGLFITPGTQNKRMAAIVGDIRQAAGPRFLGGEISKEVAFYKYRFNHKPYTVSFSVEDFIGHFTEVGYAFNLQNNDTDFWVTNHFTATYVGPGAPIEDRFLGVYMSRSWAAFIATGDPNNANVQSKITWPKYSDGAQQIVWQTQGSTTETDDFRAEGMQYIIDNILLA